MPLDFSKPIQTRDGRKVRILCADKVGGSYPIVGLVTSFGSEDAYSWDKDGRFLGDSDHQTDLINVPPVKKTVQVEVRLYRDDKSGALYSRSVCQPAGALWDSTTGFISSTTLTMEYTDEGAT